MKKTLGQKGFSLVELMIVVAIISLLAGIGIPQYQKFKAKANESEAKASMSAMFTAQHSFFAEFGTYHTSLKVVGFGSEGKTRFNVGFGTPGVFPTTVPQDFANLNTKEICGGVWGLGTDTKCNMIIDTPNIPPDSTISATGYSASAAAFEELLHTSRNHSFDSPLMMVASELFQIQSAHATVWGSMNLDSIVDVWTIDETKRITFKKVRLGCIDPNLCPILTGGGNEM